MTTLEYILQKEFRQIFRNPSILRIIFAMPFVQLLVLPWAADYEVKNVRLALVDHDHGNYARVLANKITSSGYFQMDLYTGSYQQALAEIETDRADLVLEIPVHFEKDLVKDGEAGLFIAVNA